MANFQSRSHEQFEQPPTIGVLSEFFDISPADNGLGAGFRGRIGARRRGDRDQASADVVR